MPMFYTKNVNLKHIFEMQLKLNCTPKPAIKYEGIEAFHDH